MVKVREQSCIRTHLMRSAAGLGERHLDIVEAISNGHIFHYVTRVDDICGRGQEGGREGGADRESCVRVP